MTAVRTFVLLLVAVAIALSAQAPTERLTDVVLVIDNSGSVPASTAAAVAEFADSLDAQCRLAVVAFGSEARLIVPWTVMADSSRDGVSAAILKGLKSKGLKFADGYTDVNPGLMMSDSLLAAARPMANRVIVLLTDGWLDVPGGARATDSAAAVLLEQTAPRLRRTASRVLVTGLAGAEGANTSLLADLARAAGGHMSSAPDLATLRDRLRMLARTLVTTSNQPSRSSRGIPLWIPIVGGLLLACLVTAFVVRFVAGPREGRAETRSAADVAREGQTAGELADTASAVAETMDAAREKMRDLGASIWRFGVEGGEVTREARSRYHAVANGLFTLLDNLELTETRGGMNSELARELRVARRTIEDVGIEEIRVEMGRPFVHLQHNILEKRPDSSPTGTVLSVARKGYCIRGGSPEELEVLRPADVIVSAGQEKVAPAA
ncbi:nucleotide exchange factor GrpE [candidate division WOR-3 bacterium]|uniref:Nucleotide exchange factor GrpE n=1 Tax=candidate division WOR-3 bacterium TaxID=2052148 RepID=A0A937XBV8_UNCW3|nr:nucleotide exchange factor GrpE [candidate division WOR-3 bacterium]